MIRRNVRTPDAVFGDLAAQVSSGQAASERLIAMCERYGLVDIEGLSDEIISRSEAATRAAIRKLKAGTFHGESSFDVPGGQVITLKSAVTIDPDAGEILVDFTGSTPQTTSGINVVLNYTHAYSTFAIRSCLNPDLPNNTGSLAPIKVHAPEGSIVNCQYPAPVNARHVVGMYVPMPILKALYQVMPDRVLAEGSGAVWTMQIQGKRDDGRPFTSSMFNYSGGMGARATKTGPERDLLSDRRGRRAGGDRRGGDAGDVRPQGAASRLRRRGRHARRRRADHPVPAADQGRVAAQRGAEPGRGGPRGPGRRRAGRRRTNSISTASRCATSRSSPCSRTTSCCSKRREAAATDIAELKPT